MFAVDPRKNVDARLSLLQTARCKAVKPSVSLAPVLAPASMRAFVTSAFLFKAAAKCRGVVPSAKNLALASRAPAFARILALMCVRQSRLENLHRGLSPITRTGDYSDVVVVDADGRRIPWPEVSRFDQNEMRDLMREIVNKIYTFLT